MFGLVRMETLKLVKRPMTWVLNILLLGGLALFPVGAALSFRSVNPAMRDSLLSGVTLPGTLVNTSQYIYVFGSIMLAILAASSIGSEYAWGTLRPILATGVPRGRFLAAKLLALAIAALGFVLLPLALNAALAVPIGLMAEYPIVNGTVDLAWFGSLAALIGRTYLLVLVPGLIAFLVSLAGRSQAAGIGVALGLLIGEQIVSLILLSLGFGWARTVVDLLPGMNSQALTNYNTFGPPELPADALGQGRTLLTLGLYAVACLAIAFVVFRRRDIRGAA